MESSTVVAFRALVMLACLIVVPLAAILGSAFPEVVRSVVLEKLGHKPAQTASTPGAEAPRFGQFGALPGAAPGFPSAPAPSPWNNSPQPNAAPAPAWQGSPPTMSISGGASQPTTPGYKPADVPSPFAAPAEQITSNWQHPQQTPFPGQQHLPGNAAPGNSPVLPAGGPTAVQDRTSVVQIPATAGGSVVPVNNEAHSLQQAPVGGPPGQQPDRFSLIERRLRDYGATYYRLETWGDAGEFYRFHCKMAVGNNPNYTQQFEATNGDALQAMTSVLEQVEAWRR